MSQVVSNNAPGGSPLVLTYTPPSGQTARLIAAQASVKVSVLAVSGELTITGLTGDILREKIEVSAGAGDRIQLNIPSNGIVASGIDVPIVMTVPNLGVGLAGWMICDSLTG